MELLHGIEILLSIRVRELQGFVLCKPSEQNAFNI